MRWIGGGSSNVQTCHSPCFWCLLFFLSCAFFQLLLELKVHLVDFVFALLFSVVQGVQWDWVKRNCQEYATRMTTSLSRNPGLGRRVGVGNWANWFHQHHTITSFPHYFNFKVYNSPLLLLPPVPIFITNIADQWLDILKQHLTIAVWYSLEVKHWDGFNYNRNRW